MWKRGRGELDVKNYDARSLPKRVIRSVCKSNVSIGEARWRGRVGVFLHPTPIQKTDTLSKLYKTTYIHCETCLFLVSVRIVILKSR